MAAKRTTETATTKTAAATTTKEATAVPVTAVAPVPYLGQTVLYTLTDTDVINYARNQATAGIGLGRRRNPLDFAPEPVSGSVSPMTITRVLGADGVNGQVILDGNPSFWVSSILYGTGPGTYTNLVVPV